MEDKAEDTTREYWTIWFDRNGPFPPPGGGGVIEVNKRTGEAKLIPGD